MGDELDQKYGPVSGEIGVALYCVEHASNQTEPKKQRLLHRRPTFGSLIFCLKPALSYTG